MQRILGWTCAVMLTLGVSGCVTIAKKDESVVMKSRDGMATGFINKKLDNGYRYVVYVPHVYTPAKEWPMVVFLHGAGERGDDGLAQTDVGIGRAIRFHPERFPAIVVMPQCPKDKFWDSIWPELHQAMDAAMEEYNVDEERVALTGLSMGGYGTWLWGGVAADTFSALMPICAGPVGRGDWRASFWGVGGPGNAIGHHADLGVPWRGRPGRAARPIAENGGFGQGRGRRCAIHGI